MTHPQNINDEVEKTRKRWDKQIPKEYRQEPEQMPSGAIGKDGFLYLGFTRSGRKSILHRMEKRTPLFAQKALYHDEALPDLPCVTVISTSGCVLQGDRMVLSINVGENAFASVNTQSATKVHSMDKNYGAQIQFIQLNENSYLEYLPDPLILHRNARFVNDTVIDYKRNATLIYSEVIIPGRRYHHENELNGFDYYSSTVSAKDESGNILFKEQIVLSPKEHPMTEIGVIGSFQIIGTIFILTPVENIASILSTFKAHYGKDCCYGMSTLPAESGLIFKILANDSSIIKKHIRTVWATTRKVVLNAELPAPFIWKK
ncbi:TPA: urease accessory protein UreD [Citrobacter freundii]|uniref:urease accessory protein UreD n=1 Tax=Citrobacter TaxID=544 RepID=UPI0006686C1F|nr:MULTISPECIES: urease accessory protein UreD [Citrobacter]EIN8655609.1 urease accessory protein UreD [Citrobacter freundii]EJD6422569.1 urease accessory protein UreD [Citrobacter freundii]EJD6625927.1 urease accessory protein UreD [Citrobacter freundii]EKU4669343.1 urease accessory protein UreD [Citrobacter freundii]EKX5203985.1 urease accessory protein UreD [Citrobacter freundii]